MVNPAGKVKKGLGPSVLFYIRKNMIRVLNLSFLNHRIVIDIDSYHHCGQKINNCKHHTDCQKPPVMRFMEDSVASADAD
jgi:hypothetical protein